MSKSKPKDRRCFVISPIGPDKSKIRQHADMVLNSIIKPACQPFGLVVKRGDELGQMDMILPQVIDAIYTYEVAIADLTFLNANVFYELAARHMKKLPVVQIAAEGTPRQFDIAGVRTIEYDIADWDSHVRTRESIREALDQALKEDYVVSNPITSALGEIEFRESNDPRDVVLANMANDIESMQRRLGETEAAYRELLNRFYASAGSSYYYGPSFGGSMLDTGVGPYHSYTAGTAPGFASLPSGLSLNDLGRVIRRRRPEGDADTSGEEEGGGDKDE